MRKYHEYVMESLPFLCTRYGVMLAVLRGIQGKRVEWPVSDALTSRWTLAQLGEKSSGQLAQGA
jgi:hypothetical protein